MKKVILIPSMVLILFCLSWAQNGKIVFGPLEGDSAGVILVENGSSITIPVWVRTSPGVNVVGIHWPLASKNDYVASRNGINFDFLPFVGQDPGDSSWQSVTVLAPNPMGDDYTNQGLLAIKDFPRDPYPGDGIQTEGDWWLVAEYNVTTTASNPTDTLLCDAFMAGTQPDNGGFVWADFSSGELPPNSFDYSFSCLSFSSNVYPEWCATESEYCGDAGTTLCIELCGTDVNHNDDLHIVQIGGEGEYTEEEGGPGGRTSGRWCGNLPVGTHVIHFELRDNVGGVVPLDVNVVIREVTMKTGCVDGISGSMVSIPVTITTCSFQAGGMQLLIGWDRNELTLVDIRPTGRIDDGKEYWNVNMVSPCEDCPEIDAARIVWISDINNGVHHSPAYPGEDPVLSMSFLAADGLPPGTIIPVEYYFDDNLDNKVSDSTGYNWFLPNIVDGCVEIVDAATYKGDPNMNGKFYEVGDAMIVVRYLIYGSPVWAENGTDDDAVQESSADLNNNNIVDIPDLIRFINIINGRTAPPKLGPANSIVELDISRIENDLVITADTDVNIGGVLFSLDHPGIRLGNPSAADMEILANDDSDIMRVCVYSMESNTIPSGTSTVLTIPILSDDGGSIMISEASSADEYGRMLETIALVKAPLPAQYALFSNFPNPFNSRTKISFNLPEASQIKLEVFDLLGRSVTVLADGNMDAGYHSVSWDAADHSSGMYFYKITADDFIDTRKMLLLK